MPQDKRKLTEAEVGMAKSLNKLRTPLTKKEELQAIVQRAKLIAERKKLNPQEPKKLPGKDMSPFLKQKQMQKKNEPTSTKRVVGVFSIKK